MKMFGGVLVFRGVAAADVATLQTEAKVNPIIAHFQALLTALRGARSDIADLIEVGTLFGHYFPSNVEMDAGTLLGGAELFCGDMSGAHIVGGEQR
ncbi:MAG: hypothetical protein WCD77_03145 [Acidobacteriaceae bacterium]